MTRLDDRVLGRWLDRPPPPLRTAIIITVLAVVAAVLLTVLIGDATPLKSVAFGLIVSWSVRMFNKRPRR